MASKILVTGATGTVGAHVVRELSKRGIGVRACVHTPIKAERIREANIEIFDVDYRDKKSVESAVRGMESIYLLTPFVPEQFEMASLLVDAAKKAGVKHIVKQSALGADARPAITAGRLHRQAEIYIEESGVPYTFLRPNFFMQNFLTYFGGSIRSEGKIYLPVGEGKVSYIDARDIAAVAAEVLTKKGRKGKVYSLTGPEALSAGDVAGIFSRASGRKITYVDVPEEDARKAMRELGMPGWTVDAIMELHGIARGGYASGVTSTVEDLTGKKPITFEQFAKDNLLYLKAA